MMFEMRTASVMDVPDARCLSELFPRHDESIDATGGEGGDRTSRSPTVCGVVG
jgi:hypothetical protein